MYLALQAVGEQLAHAAEAAAEAGDEGLLDRIVTVPGIIEINDTADADDQGFQGRCDLLSGCCYFHIAGIFVFPASGIFLPELISLMEYSVQAGLLLETLYRAHGIVHGIGTGSDHGLDGILHAVCHGSLQQHLAGGKHGHDGAVLIDLDHHSNGFGLLVTKDLVQAVAAVIEALNLPAAHLRQLVIAV